MFSQSPITTFKRIRSLHSHRIYSLPVVILMPHSGCNCRCVMCDIWKGNHQVRQLTEKDVEGLIHSLKTLGTQLVLLSGGEALLHPNFFRLCEILRKHQIRLSLHSTGLTVKYHAKDLARWVHDLILSIDGPPTVHNTIRNLPNAWEKMEEGVRAIRQLQPGFRITGRSVIHRLNFIYWKQIVDSARQLGLDQISFLPADVSSEAFNRIDRWNEGRQKEILPSLEELPVLFEQTERLILEATNEFQSGFIAENPRKIRAIFQYYAAWHGQNQFPYQACNAPWVSAVVEADGSVRPCFFQPIQGNIHEKELISILNSPESIRFRRQLDLNTNETCLRCVCRLRLAPTTQLNR